MDKAFIISLVNNHAATVSTRLLIESIHKTKTELEPIVLPATTPKDINEGLKSIKEIDASKLTWTYPIDETQDGIDINTGLRLTHYPTVDINRRVACTVSHMRAWQKAIDLDETIVVLEHDALFTQQFSLNHITEREDFKNGIVGINDPRGATRRAQLFHKGASSGTGLQSIPWIDEWSVPQGLAGNSAYVITPKGAKKLLHKTKEVGLWPNDALMCRQLFPWIQIIYPYYTKVQGTASTTTR